MRALTGRVVVTAAMATCVLSGSAVAATKPSTSSKSTSGSSTRTSTTTTPKGATKPAKTSARLYLDTFFVAREPVTVPDRRVHVVGVVRPYVPGQVVAVRSFLGKKLIKSDRLGLRPSHSHDFATFTETLSSPGTGTVTVAVTHTPTTELPRFTVRRAFSVISEHIGPGSNGPFVELVQQRLAALHFYLEQTGVYDQGTELAVDAYHRLLRRGTSTSLDGRTISYLLNGWGNFKVRYPKNGRHAEGDLAVQLLALIDGSKVDSIFPISSGKPSTPTILGNFHIYSRVPGYLPDGMYYSNFFIGGYAIHGYDPAPDYPASHGCMRLPISDALAAWNWLDYGDAVDVYY